MSAIIDFFRMYWLEMLLIVGAALSIFYVYKNRKSLLKKPF